MSYQSKYSGKEVDESVLNYKCSRVNTLDEMNALDTTTLREGWKCYVISTNTEYRWKSGQWNKVVTGGNNLETDNFSILNRTGTKIDSNGAYTDIIQIMNLIKSLGYSPGVNGFNISSEGVAEFKNIISNFLAILKGGMTVGSFNTGFLGSGAKIDKYGNAEMNSLMLRTFLEVPEIRFNRTTYVQGDTIQSCAGGQIKSITIDKDADGNNSNTGTIELRLEDNEIGEFDIDDICISIFCNLLDSLQNAVLTVDDGLGNRTVKGFATSMFRITDVSGERNEILTYSLRGISDRWTTLYHPQPLSTIAQRGNFSKVERQSLNISGIFPKPYLRIMHDVNYWEFSSSMIGCQFGNMENLAILGINMTGYSAYLNNIYMNGTISQFESIEPKMTFNGGGDNQIAEGQTKLIKSTITNGYGIDITDKYPYWQITRDTGDVAADNIWNAQATIENGEFYLTYSATVDDLGGKESALYTVTASDGISNPVTETISL
jgi:hypothetical protein